MLGALQSFFNQNAFSFRKKNKPNYICKDDIDKKKSAKKLKERDEAPEAKPLLLTEEKLERENQGRDEVREGIRVKVLMTKEEAARLLLKCRDGGVLEFSDVARELGEIPAARVSVFAPGTGEDRVLGGIPEEF